VKLHSDLKEFIELLNSLKVEYVVVGGHAVAFHGYPRFTGDIDFFVRPTPENAARIVAALEAFGFAQPDLNASTFTEPDKVVQLGRPPNRIDLLTSISGVTFDEAWRHRVRGELDGLPVAFIGRTQLVANKAASSRAKDLADLDNLPPPDSKLE
jgi:hypothetical protein